MYIFAVQFGMWRSWLAHHVRDVGVGRSSRLIPTKGLLKAGLFLNKYLFREVAQLASALRSGRRGRVFESPLPDSKASSDAFLREEVTSTPSYPIHTFPKGRLFPDSKASSDAFLREEVTSTSSACKKKEAKLSGVKGLLSS